jgi:hypothetical protein
MGCSYAIDARIDSTRHERSFKPLQRTEHVPQHVLRKTNRPTHRTSSFETLVSRSGEAWFPEPADDNLYGWRIRMIGSSSNPDTSVSCGGTNPFWWLMIVTSL